MLRTSAVPRYVSLIDRFQHAEHGAFDLVDDVVNDRVQADIDLLAIRQFRSLSFRSHVEADDDGVRSRSQQNVRFGDGADARMQDADLHLVRAELVQHFASALPASPERRTSESAALP